MSVARNRRRRNFTITPNEALDDDTLSLQAKGLLSIMLRYPDNWRYRLAHIETKSTNGRDSHRNALKELIQAGYARWEYKRGDEGKMAGRELLVSDEPMSDDRGPENPSDSGFDRGPENPSDGKPDTTKTETYQETENLKPLSASPTRQPEMLSSPKKKKRDASSSAKGDALATRVQEIWNQHRGPLPSVKRMSSARVKKVRAAARDFESEDAFLDALAKATQVVAKDEWWTKPSNLGKYGLDNLLAGGKVMARSEQFEAQHEPEREAPAVREGDRVSFVGRIGQMEQELVGVVTKVDEYGVEVSEDGLSRRWHRIEPRKVVQVWGDSR